MSDDLLLQLEVFVNNRPLNLICAFTLHADSALVTSRTELEEIGLRVPESLDQEVEIPLDQLPGISFVYDELAQTIHFKADAKALKPLLIRALPVVRPPDPERPPLGALVNYTLFASANDNKNGFTFGGVSGEFDSRIFDRFGLLENGFVAQAGGATDEMIRLDSRYSYQDPSNLITYAAGDFISGGFDWTRPVRLIGFQIRRSFDLRPDIVTTPLPEFSGSAAAPSTLDLFVNQVRILTTDIPEGPFQLDYPPIINGAGMAQIVLRDVLGRQINFNSTFYASPDLLAPGLTDFSAEIGLARLNYAVASADYDSRIAASASWRRGITNWLTIQAHGETAGSLAVLGGGTAFAIADIALASAAVSGSIAGGQTGGLVDLTLESRLPYLSILLRTQRTIGDYEDLASWTAILPPSLGTDRSIFGQPKELDQVSVSSALPWSGGSIGTSYIRRLTDTDSTRIVTLSMTQAFEPVSVFASAYRDFDLTNSIGLFVGVSIPLSHDINASVDASLSHGSPSAFVEASQAGSHQPGTFGWTARLSASDPSEAEGTLRYGAEFARFEASALQSGGDLSTNALMEGALTFVGGGLHATQRIDDSFALVDVGAPGVPIMQENHVVGVTDSSGQLLVTNLVPFVANRIALDPTNLPIDAEVAATSAVVAPYGNVGVHVAFGVKIGHSALLTLADPKGALIELGSEVTIEGGDETFTVGYDGEVYVRGLSDSNVALVTTPDGARCRVAFDYSRVEGNQARIENLICKPAQ